MKKTTARIPRRSSSDSIPLSFSQERVWFLEQLGIARGAYYLSAALSLRGSVLQSVLEKSLLEVTRRHESLRTRFASVDGRNVQVIDPPGTFEMQTVDIAGWPETDREAHKQALMRSEFTRPFDLIEGPLFRAKLVTLGPNDHLLLLTAHHIVIDGQSIAVLTGELTALYAAYAANQASPLPELPLQYADYAAWQRTQMTNENLTQQLAYWKQTLDGAPPAIELPTDRPRPAVATFNGATVSLPISSDLLTSLSESARREGATLFMLIMAAYQALLMRWSGQTDIVVGTPIGGRRHRELNGLIGFFANTLALRSDLSGDPSFRTLLGRVKEAALGAFANQDLPFERLVEELRPIRDLSRQPIFQVWLVFDLFNKQSVNLPGLEVTHVPAATDTCQFDLTFTLKQTPEGVWLDFGFATDLFDACTVETMAQSFRGLLLCVAADPDCRLSQLPLLQETDRERVLSGWNATGRAIAPTNLHDRIQHQAQSTPDAIALLSGGLGHYSYAQLNREANQFAHHLRRLGVRPDSVVAVCLERSPELIVALLGVLKAGGAYLPIDPSHPVERVAAILTESMISVMVTNSALADRLPVHWGQQVLTDRDSAKFGEYPDLPPDSGVHSENLAYVIYTSGSTGKPKGVAVSHGALWNHMAWMSTMFPLTKDDVVLQKTPVTFDASVWELFAPLLAGAALALAEPQAHRDARELCKECARYAVTSLQLVPSMLQLVAEEPDLVDCGALRNVFSGGEALPSALVRKLAARLLVRLHNLYGPTETTIQSIVHRDAQADLGNRVSAPIGRPIWNTQAFVLDAVLNPVPIGAAGELYIAGRCLARGYIGNPALTAERFLANPFGEPGSRMYRTGDRVRWLADGNLDFLGRTDHQVKIRGMRIELGEIEVCLANQPDVNQAVVMFTQRSGTPQLQAYVVADRGRDLDAAQLQQALSRRLPYYMVPDALLILDAFPVLRNGKIDRHSLPAPSFKASVSRAPRTPREEILAGLFADVLGLEHVGLRDSFFDLGGHSLLATKLVSRIRTALAVEVPIRLIFESPTVEALARDLDNGRITQLPLSPIMRSGTLPLSYAQQRAWFLYKFEGPSPTYNIPMALDLSGDLMVGALAAAINDLVRRHEILRTVYGEVDGVAAQTILGDSLTVALEERTASAATLGEQLSNFARHCFNLSTEIPIRCCLWALTPQSHVLLIVVHHIASDGGSLAPMMRDLSLAYAARRQQAAPAWEALRVQYADYTVWQRKLLGNVAESGSLIGRQLMYWQEALKSLPEELPLPVDRPRPAQPSHAGKTLSLEIEPRILAKLKRLARESQTTLFIVLHAAVAALLTRLGAGFDIPLGCAIAGRGDTLLDDLIGFFANTLVLRLDTSGNPSFLELLTRARSADLSAYANQDLPFENLVEALNPVRAASRHPLFQVMLTLHNNPAAELKLSGLILTPRPIPLDVAKFDLMFSFEERRGETDASLAATIDYASDLFDSSTVEVIAQSLATLLAKVSEQPELRPGAMSLLSEPESERCLIAWNSTQQPTLHGSLPALFELQVAAHPDALAIEFAEQRLTYGELNIRANQLAHRLLSMGAAPESRIAILEERSIDFIVCILAVLKAGAAYLPLHGSHPAALLRQLMERAGTRILLTDRAIPPAQLPDHVQTMRIAAEASLNLERPDNPPVRCEPNSLAYVMYTSGSTGAPKAIAVTHQNVAELAFDRRWRGAAHRRVLQHSPGAFDASTYEIWVPLLAGGTVVLAPANCDDIGVLQAVIEHKAITALFLTTALFRVIAAERPEGLRTLKTVWTGGEKASPRAFQRILEVCPDTAVVHVYGPTETTTFAASYPLQPQQRLTTCVPIGKPMDNTFAYVLDDALQPAPVGLPGELYIAGSGVTRGYLGCAALTAERFIGNPYGAAGTRMYRTGDVVRWRSSGDLEFVGRVDHQVKLRGFRIEQGEVESALLRDASIAGAVVLLHGSATAQPRLVAYVVATPGRTVDPVAVRLELGTWLPDYMVPALIVVMAEFPLTPNGKLDRDALPAPQTPVAANEFTVARTDVEIQVTEIVREVLGIDYAIGVDESFFDLGGHSIAAIQLAARIRSIYDIELPLMDLFESPTIRSMSEFIESLRINSWNIVEPVAGVNLDEGVI